MSYNTGFILENIALEIMSYNIGLILDNIALEIITGGDCTANATISNDNVTISSDNFWPKCLWTRPFDVI